MILYEYPFNERIRTLLRLEDLFERFLFYKKSTDAKAHHAALSTLFEIADISGRTDLKTDLLKELEKQKNTLNLLKNNSNIDQEKLVAVLEDIESTLGILSQLSGKPAQHILENDFLSAIRSRIAIPGATCEFDIPSYFAWQQNPAEIRCTHLDLWIKPFMALIRATNIVLKLARELGKSVEVQALKGCYQQSLNGHIYHLMRIQLPTHFKLIIPEMSANKYMLSIRFTAQENFSRPHQVNEDIPFTITLCTL